MLHDTINHRIIITIYAPMIYTASPVRNAFDAGSIHYLGKWEAVGPWKSRVFWPCEMASSR
jgi:hypothetical protein